MTLVDGDTGEIVALCTPDRARELTDTIRGSVTALWSLLAEAHDLRAWAALGYDSFKAYLDAEFDMSEVHAYRLLTQAEVIGALTEAAGLTHGLVDVTEREARDLKPHLAELVEEVEQATHGKTLEERQRAAREAMDRVRDAALQARREAQKAAHKAAPSPAADRDEREADERVDFALKQWIQSLLQLDIAARTPDVVIENFTSDHPLILEPHRDLYTAAGLHQLADRLHELANRWESIHG